MNKYKPPYQRSPSRHEPYDTSKMWVIAVISNPASFESRIRLYREFEAHMRNSDVNLLTVELVFGDKPFEVTEPGNPCHVQLRASLGDEWWHKENMINLGVSRIPDADWEYIAWIDADIEFMRRDWAIETVNQLQHFHVVQMFSHAVDLGPNLELVQTHNGFVWSWWQNQHMPPEGSGRGGQYGAPKSVHWHPGYAWAMTREAFSAVGGLIDWSLGAADHIMALSMIGESARAVPTGLTPAFYSGIKIWAARAEKFIKRDLGYVNGMILHSWHGRKVDRQYVPRWLILKGFDPTTDLIRDWQGVLQINDIDDRRIKLRDDVRRYFRSRYEDSVDLT